MITSDSFEEKLDQGYLYFNDKFQITDKITIFKPSVLDIFNYKKGDPKGGENGFYSMLNIFVGNTTYFKIVLWDNGIDWNKITDFEMFSSMVVGLKPDDTQILFGDLDFSKFRPYAIKKNEVNEETGEIEEKESFVLYDVEHNIEINELTYFRIRNYLRYMFGIFPKVETGIKGKRMKEEIIRYDRMKAKKESEDSSGSFLFPLVSSCLNYPGFKYKKNELNEVGIFEFMDSVQRIRIFENSTATLKGMMSGFVDGSKIKPEQYDFMKEIVMKPKDLKEEIKETAGSSLNSNSENLKNNK